MADMTADPNCGIVARQASVSVQETVRRILEFLKAKDITLFVEIDHSGEAAKLGLRMPNTKLLIFGHPKAGTPIRLASPGDAIDLPLKILFSQNSAGRVWLSYNSSDYRQRRHGFPAKLSANLAVVEELARICGA